MCYIDELNASPGTVDIGLIRDEANELAPHRGPHQEVQPLGENLAAMVEQGQASNSASSETRDTTPVESIPGGSTASSSFLLTYFATLVLFARVQKLEAQMAKLLHHFQPWM